jgi:hypothetical protein
MSESTARGLAGGGALLTIFSLVLPWYVLEVGSLRGDGKSGAEALGGVALVLAVLALAAGWSAVARAHPSLPVLSAAGLALLVLWKVLSPPGPASAFSSVGQDRLQSDLAKSFVNGLSAQFGIHYAPSWGIWLAAIGATAALAGTIGCWQASGR